MNRFTDTFQLNPVLDAAANGSSGPLDIRKYQYFSIQVTVGVGAASGTIALEGSNDETNPPTHWTVLSDTDVPYDTATDPTFAWDPVTTSFRWIRVTTSAATGLLGTLTLKFNGVWTS